MKKPTNASRKKARKKTGGRQKGTPNKTTVAVKEALTAAFDEMGGVESLVGWGQDNQTEFYKLWAKLLPQEFRADLQFDNVTEEKEHVVVYLPDNGRGPNGPSDSNDVRRLG